jgi:uncharacterized protein
MAMELDHSFTVPVPPDQAWDVLLDVQRIAPCMPGATVDTVDGDDVAGRLKVKVGPVSLTYKGTATFKDRDSSDRSLLVEASGKELRGAGTASATVHAALQPIDGPDATLVTLHTTLNVTGRPAQFGRGVIIEVGSRLIDKFADNLAQQLAGGTAEAEPLESDGAAVPGGAAAGTVAAESAPAETASVPAPSPSSDDTAAATVTAPAPRLAPVRPLSPPPPPPVPAADEEESLNLLGIAGPVIVKRIAPVAGAVTGVVVITWLIRRVRRRQALTPVDLT